MSTDQTTGGTAHSSADQHGLQHAELAERTAANVPEAVRAQPRPVSSIGVVGGGTMGAGIAAAVLEAGLPVVMVERDPTAADRGRANVNKLFDSMIARTRMTPEQKAQRMAAFTSSASIDALNQVDLVIEAAFEDMSVKHAVFADLDRVCRNGAVLSTNTSYLDIDAIAARTRRPHDVIGLHFFSPANVMRLLEIVVPRQAAPDAVATAFDLARRLKKLPVRSGVCDGFIGNRIMTHARQVLEFLMEDGASPYQIDDALREFGFPMGPFQVADLAGGDIGWATRKRHAALRDPRERYVQIADRLCERGWFGQKTGRGFYIYDAGARTGRTDPEVLAIIDAERQRAGITPRTFSNEEIVSRFTAALANEGANVVHEGIALRPLDVDSVFLNGFGFPRKRGGPMYHADMAGLGGLLANIERWAKDDARFWRPSPLLVQLIAQGKSFASLNRLDTTISERAGHA